MESENVDGKGERPFKLDLVIVLVIAVIAKKCVLKPFAF